MTSRRRLWIGSAAVIALFALLWGATPAHAATIFHVDDKVNDGLVAYYKLETTFDGDNTAWDSIGGNNGDMRGASAFATSALPPILGQNFGKLHMTGVVSDQIVITNPIALGLNFTVAAWVKRGQVNQFQTIFDAGTGANNGHWYVAIGDGPKSNALLFGRRGAFAELVSGAVIGNTNWHHIAVSHSATNNTLNFYLDGVRITSQANIVLTAFNGAQRIGAVSIDNTIGVGGNYNGDLDEVRLYNRTLSDNEVAHLADGFGCVFDGLSWATAFRDLQCALEVSVINDVIRVAKGRYLPGISPNAFYALNSGDNIQGGFNGNEADSGARPPLNLDPADATDYVDATKYTILTGDLRGDDPPDQFTDPSTVENEEEDNLHQIFAVASASIGISLDGVVVTGGRNDGASGAGGAIAGSPTIANSIFLFNRAVKGGGLDVGAISTPQLTNLRFVHNAATAVGGGIASIGTLSLSNSRFFSNTAAIAGGGLHVSAKSALLNNVDFEQNQSPLGGGINLSDTIQSLSYRGGELTQNEADNGGGLAINAGSQPVTLTLQGLTVQSNHASGDGGGLWLLFKVRLQILDSSYEGNQAGGQGGAVYILSPQTPSQITNSTFRDNHSLTSDGGAIEFCCTSSTLQVNNVVVEENSSLRNGGGISLCCGGGITGEHLTLSHNQSGRDGGGLYLCCISVDSTLQQVTVTANSAISNGGGIYLSGGSVLTVTNGLLKENQAGDLGGGVFGDTGGQFGLFNGVVEGNVAQGPGGAISFRGGPLRLSDVQITHNSSVHTGGGALALNNAFQVELRQVDFVENTGRDDDGAAIRIRRGTLLLERVSFLGNDAARMAGAISVEDGAQVTATNALFVGNIGNTDGGASDRSNAIRIADLSALHLINSTLAANSGPGNGLALLEGSGALTLSNVILWDNAPVTIANQGGGTLTQQNVISGDPASGTNPRFVRDPDPGDGNWATLNDNDYGDLRLRAPSPAIDRGDGALLPTAISQDFAGNPRIFDVGFVTNAFTEPVDLGALEASFVAPSALAGGPYQGNEGQPIALDGSASSDDGTIVNFAWDCTNDNSDEASNSNPTGDTCTYPDQGAFTLRLRVTDNDGISNTHFVTVTVANLDPVAQNDSATTAEDLPVTIDVLANDSDVAADPLTITATGAPQHGSAVIQAGQVRYTPNADFNGADSFTYSTSDGDGGSASATVTLTITPVDDPGADATLLLPALSK